MRILPRELSGDAIRIIAIFGLVLFVAVPFGGYYGVTYWNNGLAGVIVGLILGLVLTAIGLFFVGRSSGIVGVLAGERKASFTRREQLESDMQQARYHKTNKEYETALRKVNAILNADPKYPEALFLKAQIVWEGFGNRSSAISNLRKIHEIVEDQSSTVYRWAKSLLEEIEKNSHTNQNHTENA